jgi:outer membrane lipoprotein SlyB
MTTKWKIPAAAALSALALGGCAYHGGPDYYRGYEARSAQAVSFGVVEAIREVRIQYGESGVGAASGAMLGSIAGSYAGHGHRYGYGHGHIAGAIGGAILGGLIGQEIERSGNEREGIELTVLLDSGRYIAVIQEADEMFRPGDRVRVLSGRGSTRVTH